MWDVLKEYPAARVRLEAIAVKRLEKYKKAPLEKGRWMSDRYFKLLFVIIFFCDEKKNYLLFHFLVWWAKGSEVVYCFQMI